MPEYGNYQQPDIQTNPVIGPPQQSSINESTHKKTDFKASNSKTSEVSQAILTPPLSTIPKHLADLHAELKNKVPVGLGENETPSPEAKANSFAPKKILMNGNNKKENTISPIILQKEADVRQTVEAKLPAKINSISESSLSKLEQIAKMSKEELFDLLDSSAATLTQKEFDLAIFKLDEYDAKELEKKSEISELSIAESESSIAESEMGVTKKELSIAESKLSIAESDMGVTKDKKFDQLAKDALILDSDGVYRAFKPKTDNIKQVVISFNLETGVFTSLSKEHVKNHQVGDFIKVKDGSGGTKQVQIKEIKVLTKEEFKAFTRALIIAQRATEQPEKDSLHKDDPLSFLPRNQAERTRHTERPINNAVRGRENIRSGTTDKSTVVDEKLNHIKKHLEIEKERKIEERKKLEKEIQVHETLIGVINKDHLAYSLNYEEYKLHNLKLDHQAKENFKDLEGVEIPLPLKVKLKEVLILHQEIGKIIPKHIKGTNQVVPAFMMETLKFKEEQLAVINDVMKLCGTTYNKGTGSEGKTSA